SLHSSLVRASRPDCSSSPPLSSSSSSSFFSSRSGALRDLHSFPTRRSSDLSRVPRTPRDLRRADPGRGALPVVPGSGPPGRRRRSEEHTSELQSRFDLVCRLLLEKKKTTWRPERPGEPPMLRGTKHEPGATK